MRKNSWYVEAKGQEIELPKEGNQNHETEKNFHWIQQNFSEIYILKTHTVCLLTLTTMVNSKACIIKTFQ